MNLAIFESEDYLAVNKSCGSHFDEVITQSEKSQWEPVHRLDFETSGVLLFARPELVDATRKLFQDSESGLKKLYIAGTYQEIPDSFTHGRPVQGWIGSRYRSSKKVRFSFDEKDFKAWHSVRQAFHKIRPLEVPNVDLQGKMKFSGPWYEIELLTGARHQIRAFFAAIGTPLRGDPLYGSTDSEEPAPRERLGLHSWKLEFEHPLKKGEFIKTECWPA